LEERRVNWEKCYKFRWRKKRRRRKMKMKKRRTRGQQPHSLRLLNLRGYQGLLPILEDLTHSYLLLLAGFQRVRVLQLSLLPLLLHCLPKSSTLSRNPLNPRRRYQELELNLEEQRRRPKHLLEGMLKEMGS
jgi:hypothetical protein